MRLRMRCGLLAAAMLLGPGGAASARPLTTEGTTLPRSTEPAAPSVDDVVKRYHPDTAAKAEVSAARQKALMDGFDTRAKRAMRGVCAGCDAPSTAKHAKPGSNDPAQAAGTE